MRSPDPTGFDVQGAGGLPSYICRIARAVKKTGKTTSQAIAIAVSRVKMWATGKGVDKDTQAKAAEAVAEWEKLRAKSHTKSAAKTVKASASWTGETLVLANTSFNTDAVRKAWEARAREWETKNASTGSMGADVSSPYAYSYVKELWTDYMIVSASGGELYRVDYEVNGEDGAQTVDFDDPVPVRVEYVTITGGDMVGSDLSDSELQRLTNAVPPCYGSAVDRVLLSITAGRPTSPVERILALASSDKGPYGDVTYADPTNKKYPINDADKVRAAWSYINMPKNQKDYSAAEVAAIKAKIKAAAKRFGVEISGD